MIKKEDSDRFALLLNSYAQFQLNIDSGKNSRNNEEEIDRYKELCEAAIKVGLNIEDINISVVQAKECLKKNEKLIFHKQ